MMDPVEVTLRIELDGVRQLTPYWRRRLVEAVTARVQKIPLSQQREWRWESITQKNGTLWVTGTCSFPVDNELYDMTRDE